MGQVLLNGAHPLLTNLIGVRVPTFFPYREGLAPAIYLLHIELGNGPASHASLSEGIDDGPVAIRAIPFTSRPLAGFIALPITREAANSEEQIRRIEELAPLGRCQRPLHLKSHADGWELHLRHRIPQGEGPELVHPLGEGFEVGHDPEQGFVTPDASPLVMHCLLHVPLKIA